MNLLILIEIFYLAIGTLYPYLATNDASTDSTSDPVVILEVSSRLDDVKSQPKGSIVGGTTLYMKVSGLDQTASNNAVYIGSYPCLISDKGVNGLFMNCKTSASNVELTDLPIIVMVAGKNPSTCTFSSKYCTFSYLKSLTPQLYYVTPSANFARSNSYWRGKYTVPSNDVIDIDGQFIGNERCDRFEIKDDYSVDIDPTDDIVVCQISAEIEAGYYNYQIKSANGYQLNTVGIQKRKVNGESYESKIVPMIEQINTNICSSKGQIIQISGYGFSVNLANNKLKINQQDAKIISVTTRVIQALIPSLNIATDSLYIGGSGLFLSKYDFTGTSLYGQCASFRTQITNNPVQIEDFKYYEGIATEPDLQDNLESNFGYYYRGFFKAPTTGKYRFYVASDDCATLYLQSTPLSTERSTMTFLAQNTLVAYRNYWYNYLAYPTYNPNQLSNEISLNQDDYHYIEIYYTNKGTTGHLTVSMEVESDTGNQINDLYSVTSSYNAVNEIIELKLYNSKQNTLLTGTYALKINYGNVKSDGTYNYVLTNTLSPTTTADQLASTLNTIGLAYRVNVIRTKVDNTGNEVDDSSQIYAGFRYQIIFKSYRTSYYKFMPTIYASTLTGGTVKSQIQTIQDALNPISGTFQMAYVDENGNQDPFYFMKGTEKIYDLPYDTTTVLADNIERITGLRPLIWTEGKALDGWIWRIQLRGIQSLNIIMLSNNLLSGNGPVDLQLTTTITHSSNRFYEPIPNELLFTYSDQPQLTVEVNGILGVCTTDCSITLDDANTPTLTAFTRNNQELSLTLESINSPSDLTIQFAGQNCNNIVINNEQSPYSITCQLITEFEAGDSIPSIHIQNIGYSKIDGVTAESIDLVVTSITPDVGSPDGGNIITICGSGFPIQSIGDFTLQFNGQTIIPQSFNNAQIVIVAPPGSGSNLNINLSFNGKTAQTHYTYDDALKMQIDSLEFNSKGPTFRGTMTIQGTGFGSDNSILTVKLENESKSYDCKVISAIDTELQVYLRGGMPGEYKAVVYKENVGQSRSTNNVFKYQTIITSVTLMDDTPAIGSEAGGTKIKIQGINFILDETIVFIGWAQNWICELDLELSTNDILYCTTPSKYESYTSNIIDVVVTTKITLESVCGQGSTCVFEYSPDQTPDLISYPLNIVNQNSGRLLVTIENEMQKDYNRLVKKKQFYWTLPTKVQMYHGQSKRRDLLSSLDLELNKYKLYNIGDQETLTLEKEYANVQIIFQCLDCTPIIVDCEINGNEIKYTIPSLIEGDFSTKIKTPIGFANKMWNTRIAMQVNEIVQTTYSIYGGTLILNGQGFSDKLLVLIGTSYICNNVITTPLQLSCDIPTISQGIYNLTVSYQDKHVFYVVDEIDQKLNITVQDSITIISSTPRLSSITGLVKQSNYYQIPANTIQPLELIIVGTTLNGITGLIMLYNDNVKIQGTVNSITATQLSVTFNEVPIGIYHLKYQIDLKNANELLIVVQGAIPTLTPMDVSYAGGNILTINGDNFDTLQSHVQICGFDCPIKTISKTQIDCQVPPLKSKSILDHFHILNDPVFIQPSQVHITTPNFDIAYNIFDQLQTTYYSSSTSGQCSVDFNFGTEKLLILQQFRYLPRIDVLASYLKGTKFQYSIDGATFIDFITIDQSVHTGWNIYVPNEFIENVKIIRFLDPVGTTYCQMSEIEIKGWLIASTQNDYQTSAKCSVQVQSNGYELPTIADAITYKLVSTPVVDSVTPLYGSPLIQTLITINGNGFVESQTFIKIDGIECAIQSLTSTLITCLSGLKDTSTNPLKNDFQVLVNGNLAINSQIFKYASRWSDVNTWGGYIFPSDGDSIIVNKGECLLVDQLTPKLVQILVEGELIFLDEGPTSLNAEYIIIRMGKFQIGTLDQPHLNQVTITLRGEESDIQMPSMGNKVLGCHQCVLDIHGKVRTPTWTLLSSTANIGDTVITVDDDVDWVAGEQIFVTSSETNHAESEVRIIKEINGKQITLDRPLKNKHYSETETFGTSQFPMKVEVGLLTRNIVIKGEESSKLHGAHLMIHGQSKEGAIGRISYTEFIHGGQPRILGRYPIHFHLNGEVDESIVLGNSIHNAYCRCVTVHGVHYLKIQKNVCYESFGHGIFLEDGIETNNIIEDNLVAGIRQSWIMLQTDITCSTYWITNPQNIVRRNRSGGSEWYGFWYEVKIHPDGPSATSDICPQGLNLIEFDTNWAHSNGRFGIRIFVMVPREYPCMIHKNIGKEDPYEDNPSIQAVFSNFWTWKNGECGVLAEEVGNVVFRDMMIADSKLAGFQAHLTNYSREGTTLQNIIFVGKSNNNVNIKPRYYNNSRGIITPRSNGFYAKNIEFYNYDSISNQSLFQSLSKNGNDFIWVVGGKNSHFENVTIVNSETAYIVKWWNFRREIYWDIDGSITQTVGGAYIIPYKKHIDGIPGCVVHPNRDYDNGIVCAMNQVEIRDILINNPTPSADFQGVDAKFYRLDDSNVEEKMDRSLPEDQFQLESMVIIKKSKDIPWSYAAPFATGYTYNVHFKFGASDFLSMGLQPSQYFKPENKGIVFRFNYSANRETFDIYRNLNFTFPLQYDPIEQRPDPNNCNNGEWYNNRDKKLFYICMSGKNKIEFEFIESRGIICRLNCSSLVEAPVDDTIRYWSNPSTWENGIVPTLNDNVTIQATYQVVLDIDPPELNTLTILGHLIFDERRASSVLKAHYIWVYSGKLLAGSSSTPFPGQIRIEILGEFGENALVIDQFIDAGNKVLAVTGGIELYGPIPSTRWTRLAVYAESGQNTVYVIENDGWKVGDEIIFGPSGGDPGQQDKRTITNINGKQITLDRDLDYDHYGDSQITFIKENIGQLDMRAAVGHLSRNIKIVGGPSTYGLGCRVLIYQFNDPLITIPRRGYAKLYGVEFENCGQYDTDRAGLDFRSLKSTIVINKNEVIGCSFHDSTGMLMNVYNSEDLIIQHNVFYKGIKALVQINNCKFVQFNYNLMVYVKKRIVNENTKIHNWALLGNFFQDIPVPQMTTDIFDVSDNVGQGSEDSGFFMMSTACHQIENASFQRNECSSTVLACVAFTQSTWECSHATSVSAYHSAVGVMFPPNTLEARASKMMLVENKRGFVQKSAPPTKTDNQALITDFYINSLARPNCLRCYDINTQTQCNNTVGFQLIAYSGVSFPPMNPAPSDEMDIICSPQKPDGRAYLNNVQFENLKMNYTNLPQCGFNAAFRQHFFSLDMSAQHYLTNSPCINCDFEALFFNFSNPLNRTEGWFGGCGSFSCTGMKNVLIEDQDGKFFGQIGQAIANNTYFGPNVTYCSRIDSWNGYWCPGRRITVLAFMSIAPDYNKRLYSPVKLTDGIFFNEINSYAEWSWDGAEPLNLRESKFVALVTANTIVNMSNAGTNPTDSEYWLSRRFQSGSPEDYLIVKLQFQVPQVIQVSFNEKVIQPGITKTNQHYDLMTMTNICGANNYFYENRTIHFVLTGELKCFVTVSVKNTVQISTRLIIKSDEFLGDKFLQYAVAQLGGDPYNYFILGTKTKSNRFLQQTGTKEITVNWAYVDKAQIGTDDSSYSQTRLEAFAGKLTQFNPSEVGEIAENSLQIHSMSRLQYNSTETNPTSVTVIDPTTDTQTQTQNNNGQTSTNETQSTNSNPADPPYVPDDSLPFTNPKTQNNQTESTTQTQEQLSKRGNTSTDQNTMTIVISVVVSVVGVAMLVIGVLCFKKWQMSIRVAQMHQRVENQDEFAKPNQTEENLRNSVFQ